MIQKNKNQAIETLKSNLDSISYNPNLSDETYQRIIDAGFQTSNRILACIASGLAIEEHPITLRGLFYRIVSTGFFPSTADTFYKRTGRMISSLRRKKMLPYPWIVDSMRQTQKPSSWSGLSDFAETVRNAYRMDFWQELETYVHVFCEKDAIAGTVAPITRKYDVALSPIRGYCSDSYAWNIAQVITNAIDNDKEVRCYYIGDYDPSGFDIERDIREKLANHVGNLFDHYVTWERLGVNEEDFAEFDLIELKPKQSDNRVKSFLAEHGNRAAEIDAIPPTALRRRIESAILQSIPAGEWERPRAVEKAQSQSWREMLEQIE